MTANEIVKKLTSRRDALKGLFGGGVATLATDPKTVLAAVKEAAPGIHPASTLTVEDLCSSGKNRANPVPADRLYLRAVLNLLRERTEQDEARRNYKREMTPEIAGMRSWSPSFKAHVALEDGKETRKALHALERLLYFEDDNDPKVISKISRIAALLGMGGA